MSPNEAFTLPLTGSNTIIATLGWSTAVTALTIGIYAAADNLHTLSEPFSLAIRVAEIPKTQIHIANKTPRYTFYMQMNANPGEYGNISSDELGDQCVQLDSPFIFQVRTVSLWNNGTALDLLGNWEMLIRFE